MVKPNSTVRWVSYSHARGWGYPFKEEVARVVRPIPPNKRPIEVFREIEGIPDEVMSRIKNQVWAYKCCDHERYILQVYRVRVNDYRLTDKYFVWRLEPPPDVFMFCLDAL